MVKREKKRKLGGSVLLTVVCVMSLLIIFLFGTLALATAANNRAHVNYSTAQTDVTSRTVVDAAIKAMEANTDFGNAVSNLNTVGGSSGFEVNVQLGDGTEGRYGHIKPVQVKYVGTKKFYDTEKKEWIDGDIVEFLSQVNMAGVESSTAAYIVKQPPEVSIKSNAGGGAGFVTTAGAELTCSSNLYGGTYINLPKLEDAEKFDYRYRTNVEYANNWGKDSSGDYIDETLYRHFAPFNKDDANTYFWLGKDGGADAEADLYINNNMYIQEWKDIIFTGKSEGITVWGDFVTGTQVDKLRYVFYNMPEDEIQFNEMPYIYVDGTIRSIGSKIYLGNPNDGTAKYPLNIFCGSISTANIAGDKESEVTDLLIDGDLFCMNENETSIIKPLQVTTLYSWAGSVINKVTSEKNQHRGSIYSKGNVKLSQFTIDGDVRVEGDCTIGSGVKINGNLVVGGKLKIESGAKLNLGTDSKIYCDASIAEGLNEGVVQESKYVEVPTILHNVSENPNAEKVENKQRYYLAYDAQVPLEGEPGYNQYNNPKRGLFGEEICQPNVSGRCYYEWIDDFNPDDIPFDYKDIGQWKAQSEYNVTDYIKSEVHNNSYGETRPANPVDGSVDYYYVKTVWDETAGKYVTKSEPTDKASYYVDKNTHEIVEDFRTVPNMDGSDKGLDKTMAAYVDLNPSDGYTKDSESVWYSKETGSIVSISEATPGALVTYPVESFGEIYPEYAERDVIIGEKTLPGVNKSDTQIVKTMEDVLNDVADPYKDGQLSLELSNRYTNLKNKIGTADESSFVFRNVTDILKAHPQKKYADAIKEDGSYNLADAVLEGVAEDHFTFGTANSKSNGGAIITNDCILDNLTIDGSHCGYLVFDPGSRDILVIVNNLTLNNQAKIIVNDSQGGTVNFYIEKDCGMTLAAQGWIAPTSYLKAFVDNKNDGNEDNNVLTYNTSGIDGVALEKLGKPKINIYAGQNSILKSTESKGFIANIISPDLTFKISAGEPMEAMKHFKKYYYNGRENTINNPFLLGCINSSFADAPNNFNVLFVTDSETGAGGSAGGGESAFNYRVLYYDEY